MGVRFTLLAIALQLILADFYSNFVNANLTVHPKDAVVLVNQPTYFNCSTSARNINANFVLWYHYSLNSATRNDVYDEGNIMFEYKDRFRIEVNLVAGVFNLVIERPNLTDAGRYECQDGVGQGDKASAELIVLDENPSCESNMNPDGVIGQNDCGLEPDVIQLTCNVISSRGNILPTLEWKISGDKSSSSLIVCEPSTSCILTLKGNLAFNNQSFVCQTTKARRQQYGCSISPIKVKYALRSRVTTVTTDRDVQCFANTSQLCTYKWYNDKDEEVSANENLGEQHPGDYTCKAECDMKRRNESCGFIAMEVHVKRPDRSGLYAVFVLLPLLICIIVACLFYKRHKHKIKLKKQNSAHLPSPGQNQVKRSLLTNDRTLDVAVYSQLESSDELSSSLPIITDQGAVDKLTINQYFIDRGSSAAIYGPFRWQDKKCVVKQILFSPDKLTKELEDEITQLTNRCRELDHPHLSKIFEVWLPSPALYIVMEYAEGKSLDKLLRPKDASYPLTPFPREIVQNWALQIAEGMKYLHEKKLVHRNLKAAHVLVMESPDVSQKTLKIGSYTLTKAHDHSTVMSLKGTMAWMAPEYIRGEPFSMLSDVWSYGVTVWEIMTRDVPYKEVRKETDLVRAAINKTLKLKIPDSCPEPLQDLLTNCWNYEVNERPSFKDICFDLRALIKYDKSCVQ